MASQSKNALTPALLFLWGISCAIMLSEGRLHLKAVKFFQSFASVSLFEKPKPQELPKSTLNRDRLILQGDVSQATETERWAALHDMEPGNPVYYANLLNSMDEVPNDFEEKVTELDPNNGWFQLWQASLSVDDFLESVREERSDRKKREAEGAPAPVIRYDITDEEKFAKSLSLLKQGLQAPKQDSYFSEMAAERFDALPEANGVLENARNIAIMSESYSGITVWKNASQILSAAIQTAQTEEEFFELESLALAMKTRHWKEVRTLVDGLVYQATSILLSANLRETATRIGLEEKSAFYRDQHSKYQAYNDHRKQPRSDEFTQLMLRRADIFSAMAYPAMAYLTKSPIEITREELKPALRAERAFASRIFYGLIVLILNLAALITWLRKRDKANPALFQPEVSVLALGVLLPFVLLIAFRYFFSFGMLDYGGRLLGFGNYLHPEIATLLILFAVPVCLLRSRAYPEESRKKIWWPVAVAVTSLFFAAAMIPLVDLRVTPILISASPVLSVIALIGLIFPRLKHRDKSYDLTSRLAPAFLFSAALVGLFSLGLKYEEHFWFAKTELMRPSPNGFTIFEDQVVEILKAELEEVEKP